MKHLNYFYLLLLLLLTGVGVYFIFKPFLISIVLAFILSRLFYSWYQKIQAILRNESIAAFLATLLLLVVIFLPIFLVGKIAAEEVVDLYRTINLDSRQLSVWQDRWQELTKTYPFLNTLVSFDENSWRQLAQNINHLLILLGKYLYQNGRYFLFTLFITTFCLYYFFKDGDRLIKKIMQLSPLSNQKEQKLLDDFINVSRATLRGSLIIAIVQGLLATLIFLIFHIPSAVLLGVLTTIFALIPMIGTAIIWLPVGLILVAQGSVWAGIIILLYGALIVGSVDNLLRPQLIKNTAHLHPLLVFLSTMGGLAFFGLAGFILGPVLTVFFLNLLSIYQEEFQEELERFNQGE